MCLITTQTEPFIAEKNITVYKVLTSHLTSSYFGDYQYVLGELNETIIKKSNDWSTFDSIDNGALLKEISSKSVDGSAYISRRKWAELGYISYGQGYHSALKKSRISTGWGEVLVRCTIPKGSQYYTNPSGLVISNKLIIKKRLSIMCLITPQQEPLIAQEDIITYKVISNKLTSCFKEGIEFQYALKELYETTIEPSDIWSAFDSFDHLSIKKYVNERELMLVFETNTLEKYLKCFGQGFHSALNKERLLDNNVQWGVRTLVKCIIPKGSEYYTNISGLVISNKLFIDEKDYHGCIYEEEGKHSL